MLNVDLTFFKYYGRFLRIIYSSNLRTSLSAHKLVCVCVCVGGEGLNQKSCDSELII